MNCREVEARLDLHVERELAGAERVAVENHLRSCPACRGKLRNLQQVTTLLYQLPSEEPAPDLVARILAAVEVRAATARVPRWMPRTVAVGLGLAFSAFLLLWLGYETLVALQQGEALYLMSLILSDPEVLSRYPQEVVYAILESLPLFGLILTLGACLITSLLLEQLVRTLSRPPQAGFNGNHY